MLHQLMREPRCVHCTDQPASKCRDCQHSNDLYDWRYYWRYRRSMLDWTVTPTRLLFTGSGSMGDGSVLSVYDPTTDSTARVNLPLATLYLADVIKQGVLYCEAQVFAKPVAEGRVTGRWSTAKPQDQSVPRPGSGWRVAVPKAEAVRRATEGLV